MVHGVCDSSREARNARKEYVAVAFSDALFYLEGLLRSLLLDGLAD